MGFDRYNYRGIVSTFEDVALDIKEAKLFYGIENGQEMRIIDNVRGDWGDIYPMVIFTNETFPLPCKLELRWITIVDLRCYELSAELDTVRMEEMWEEQGKKFPEDPFRYVVVGIAPYGMVTLWLRSKDKAVLFQQLAAKEVEYNDREKLVYSKMTGDDEVMKSILSKEQIDSLMRQYQYRFVPLEEYFDGRRWRLYPDNDGFYETIDIDRVEVKCVDGTFDFTNDGSLYKNHTTGMPKRITVRWKEGNVGCFAHFWLDPYYVTWFFESLYKKYPEKPADLLLRLDTRTNHYEVAMTADGLEPRAFIGTQYIVFRDNVEICRSEHFYKEEREWDW